MYGILLSRICIPADKDWNIIPNMYMKYIFDDIFQIYFKNIFTLFVCDIQSSEICVHSETSPVQLYICINAIYLKN